MTKYITQESYHTKHTKPTNGLEIQTLITSYQINLSRRATVIDKQKACLIKFKVDNTWPMDEKNIYLTNKPTLNGHANL